MSGKVIAVAALLGFAQATLYGESDLNHTCVIEPSILSCSASADPATVDTCCTETYGGLLLSTQFWSTYTGLEAEGQKLPADTWTLHGLWPDFCNGSYTQYCDLSRQYDPVPSPNTTSGTSSGTPVPPYTGPDIGTFLERFAKYDLLAWMETYWINQMAKNSFLWAHEYSKHATCFSTFDIPCYGPQYVEHEEVVDFFETAVKYYQRLPTFKWLANAGITPSNSSTFTLADFQAALTKEYGATPYIGCSGARYNTTEEGAGSSDSGRTVISEVWYYSHVQGRPQEGISVPVNAGMPNSSCAKTASALHYYEMTPGSVQGS